MTDSVSVPLEVCTDRDWSEEASKSRPECERTETNLSNSEQTGIRLVEMHLSVGSASKGGTKYDAGKPDFSLLPKPALELMTQALMYGENKYGRYNYTHGFESHRLFASTQRHLLAWQDGETYDPESGLSHLAHAMANLAIMTHCQALGTLTDTRNLPDSEKK